MFREASVFRALIAGLICVPLALFLGYLLATPDRTFSLFWLAVGLSLITLPLLLRWHHSMLIILWNIQVLAFMLPGKPKVVFVVAAVSIVISVFARTLRKEGTYIHCPWVAFPLIILAAITLFTLDQRGGAGGRVFGSEVWGASRYLGVLGAIICYFALVASPVPPNQRKLMASLFFLSGTTALLVDIFYLAGPSFYFLLSFFPDVYSSYHAYYLAGSSVQRFAGISGAATHIAWFMLMMFGIRGIFDWRHPWRWGIFLSIMILGLLGGYRGLLVGFGMLFAIQFYLEGLFRSPLLLVFAMVGLVGGSLLVGFADRLPMAMQRSLSFLPLNIDPVARQDAISTLQWRVEMWQTVAPEISKYLFLGKGFAFDGSAVYLSQFSTRYGFAEAYEQALITGDYHQGILTLIIPLGIWGFLAFVAFCWGSFRALYANYKYGDPKLTRINTFLLAFFVMKLIWYLIFYGEFFLDLLVFVGIIGMSLTLNGGVAKRAVPVQEPAVADDPGASPVLQPAYRSR